MFPICEKTEKNSKSEACNYNIIGPFQLRPSLGKFGAMKKEPCGYSDADFALGCHLNFIYAQWAWSASKFFWPLTKVDISHTREKLNILQLDGQELTNRISMTKLSELS